MSKPNDFVISVATANGSGSQSSNNILVRSLFRMGVPVGGKNLFPSNIQGLPTWFTIRANDEGFTARKKLADVVVCMNPATAVEDFKLVRPGGFVFVSSEIKLPEPVPRADVTVVKVPFKDIVQPVSDSVKLRKLLINMIYVGVLAELLKIPDSAIAETIAHQFGSKGSVIETNNKAIAAGREYAKNNLAALNFPFRAEARPGQNNGKVLIDGNTAGAMGLVFGGCTFVSWYPITPSSSVVESFIELAEKYRVKDGKRDFAVVQAEDELAAAGMVVGAGWAGARAVTATSGPGVSLMAETAGLAYYAEIPAVIWDVQRVGPSTGLPTRTMQGDLLSAYYLSHGDTKHVVLLPGSAQECFEFGQTALDLAEELQTLVLVLSDLDLGMNLHIAPKFGYPNKPIRRGKVLSKEQIDQRGGFQRYKDVDGDGIGYRTVTGVGHNQGAYFTRGTGHDEAAAYSEKPEVYQANMERLTRKFQTAAKKVPQPFIDQKQGNKIGLISFGSSSDAMAEARLILKKDGLETSHLVLKALPFSAQFEEFLKSHQRIYVVEQNRDGQLATIMRAELPQYWNKCHSVLHYDGMPLDAETVVDQIVAREKTWM
jgi:2-oxoglutarate ferredoxin oxidoreductase subunit alpha